MKKKLILAFIAGFLLDYYFCSKEVIRLQKENKKLKQIVDIDNIL